MNASHAELAALTFPELVIGIAGPIGVDLDQIASSFKRRVGCSFLQLGIGQTDIRNGEVPCYARGLDARNPKVARVRHIQHLHAENEPS